MTRSRSILGLLVLSALALCGFGASNASAATWHECVNTGGGTGTKYTNAECNVESGTGAFETVPVAAGAHAVNVTPTTNAAGDTKFRLAATVGGVNFEIQCTGLETPNGEGENVVVGTEMKVKGHGKSKFTGCATSKPAGGVCVVPTTIETVELSTETIGTSTEYKPASGTTFVTIPVTGASCPAALKGEKAVQGTARSAASGVTKQEFSSTSGSSLTFGGQAATFTGAYHFATKSNGTVLALETP